MRAVRFHGRGDIRLENVREPGPLESNQVLIKPRYCGICGTDLHEYVEGARVIPSKPHPLTGAALPQILGHELSADVEAIGPEVSDVKPGDRVSLMPLLYCGRCYFCRRGLNHLWPWGGFAEYAVVPDYTIVVLPPSVSYEQGALLEPAAVAAYAVERGGVQGGDSVLIAGAGPIGVLSILYATAIGAGQVFVTETNAQRLELAKSLGVSAVLNPRELSNLSSKESRDAHTGLFDASKSPVVDALRELTGGRGVDVAIDCTGNEAGLNTCINAVRGRGSVVECALHVRPPAIDMYALALKDIRLESTWCYSVYDFPRYASLIATGRLPVEKAITAKVSLEEIEDQGFRILADPNGLATKILVYPEAPSRTELD
jgi:(R,R)-butanediol dehydrogenase/meso-butanediol dehydrogenase/diacetyl reductase